MAFAGSPTRLEALEDKIEHLHELEAKAPSEFAGERRCFEHFLLGNECDDPLFDRDYWRELNRNLEIRARGAEQSARRRSTRETIASLPPRPGPNAEPRLSDGSLDLDTIRRCAEQGGISPDELWLRDRDSAVETATSGLHDRIRYAGVRPQAFDLIATELYTAHFDCERERQERELAAEARALIPTGSAKRRFKRQDQNGTAVLDLVRNELAEALPRAGSTELLARRIGRIRLWTSEAVQGVRVFLTVKDVFIGVKRGRQDKLTDAEFRMIKLLTGEAVGMTVNSACGVASDLLNWYVGPTPSGDALRKRYLRFTEDRGN